MQWDPLIARAIHLAPVAIIAGLTYFAIFLLMVAVDIDADTALYWALLGALVTALATLFVKLVLRPYQPNQHGQHHD